jgi:hypothetical protein
MQDDQLSPHLTVLEAMTASANLKLSKEISSSAKRTVIEEIMATLGLAECVIPGLGRFPCANPHLASHDSGSLVRQLTGGANRQLAFHYITSI